jgi:hypothetical protein
MNSKLRQNIDFAISRFEASDITTIIEVHVLLCVVVLGVVVAPLLTNVIVVHACSWRRSSTTSD